MKTQTSKTKIWLSSLILLPIIAILFYSFSSKKYVEKKLEVSSALIESTEKIQNIPTAKQIADYNSWAKKTKEKYKTLPEIHKIEGFPIMDKKVFNYYNSIYKRMSTQQLKNSESFPEAAIAPPPPPPPYHKGKVSKSMVNTYNQWIKSLKNTDGTYNIITKEDYTYYISIYNNMTEEQKKNSAGLPPPPPPPSAPKPKQNKEEEREIPAPPPPPIPENVSPEERARMINVTEAYAKKHPESVTKAKIGGEIVDVVEMPMDDEGTTEIFGKKYKYSIKDGETTYFDTNKEYTEDEFKKYIQAIEKKLNKTKKLSNEKVKQKQIALIEEQPQLIEEQYALLEEQMPLVEEEIALITVQKTSSIPKKEKRQPNTDNCLEITNEFNLNTTKTLSINCIEDYPNNKLQIYNRWGKLIFSKENYKNDWDGTVGSEFTSSDNGKIQSGTLYYIIEADGLKEQKAGWLSIVN